MINNINKLVEDWFCKVDEKIITNAVAKQFALEEIEGASLGNYKSQKFAKNSGFSEIEYIDSMTDKSSFEEVDGGDGPQQVLTFKCHLPLREKFMMIYC